MIRMLYGAMNFPIRPILQELELIAGLGFDYLEMPMDPPEVHHGKVRQQKEALMQALDRHRMPVICHLPTFVSTADLTRSLREASLHEMLQSLELAAELQSLKVVLHPSHMGGLSVLVMDKAKKYALRSLEAIVEKADQLGLPICIENLFPRSHSLVNPEDFVEVFERFPSLKMTLDTGHAHMGAKGGTRTLEFIERYSDRIAHIHVSDNFGNEDSHLPVGTGTVDFPKILRALKAVGYDDTMTLEVFSRDRDYLRISREKLEAMFASLQTSL